MRRDFPAGTRPEDALAQIPHCHTGHKHQGRKGPGKAQRKINESKLGKDRKRRERVAAYWRGERDEFP